MPNSYLIDSHCHLHDRSAYNYALSRQQFDPKLLKTYPDLPHQPADFTPEKMLARAHAASVKKMICVGTSHEDSLAARSFALSHAADGVFWSYGIHPNESNGDATGASEYWSEKKLFASALLVAIGEVGLDYHESSANRKNQIRLLEQMLQLAKTHNLPLIFHVRDAFDDFFPVLDNFSNLTGVIHSFSDSPENLKKSLDRGFCIGVNGLATFAKNIPLPPLEKMLLETDAPFLTPAPFRGTINESAHIKDICAYISSVKGEPVTKVAEITTKNAERLFKI